MKKTLIVVSVMILLSLFLSINIGELKGSLEPKVYEGLPEENQSYDIRLTNMHQPVIFAEHEFITTITLEGLDRAAGFQLTFEYDAFNFELKALNPASSVSSGMQYNINELGKIYVNFSDVNTPLDGTVTLFELTFKVRGILDHDVYSLIELDRTAENVIAIMTEDGVYETDDIEVELFDPSFIVDHH